MKLRLNKSTLSQMPEQVRALVTEWRDQHHKSFVSVETTPSFFVPEDARCTIINLLTGVTGSAQAAGEFAGFTKLGPCDPVPLPEGCTAVITGFFCGVPFCDIKQGGKKQLEAR